LETRNVYFISGLGADWRLFKKLVLPERYVIVHLEWIAPLGKETILEYAARLAQKIDASQPFYLVGLSFGGMVAAELTRLLHPEHTIILSSAAHAKDLPWYYKTAGFFRLPQLVPVRLLQLPNPFSYWFFGVHTPEEKNLLKQVLRDMDPQFVRWALKAITTWKTTDRPRHLFHIHGTADKVLPIRYLKPDFQLKGGEHLMVYTQAERVSEILVAQLGSW
jgi:pimeloyl-ACP methyl ester carboxylesterase